MHRTTTFIAAAAAVIPTVFASVTGELGDAKVVRDNPIGRTYLATLPEQDDSNIRGTIRATSGEDGVGVKFDVDVTGLPDEDLGPFGYHIHVAPVPADGNCTATLAHFDPTIRGEEPKCDKSQPETCQVGDLSGKYGSMEGDSFHDSYLDKYSGLTPGTGAFFGNRSIVIHLDDKTRVSCANFKLVDAGAEAVDSDYGYADKTTNVGYADGVKTVLETAFTTVATVTACPDTDVCSSAENTAVAANSTVVAFANSTMTTMTVTDVDVDAVATDATVDDLLDGLSDLGELEDAQLEEIEDELDASPIGVDDDGDAIDAVDEDDLAVDVDGIDAVEPSSTLTGGPVQSTGGATSGAWVSGGAVVAALAAFVL